MLKDALLKVKILDGTELDKRLTRTTVKFENGLTVTLPNSLIHFEEKVAIPEYMGKWLESARREGYNIRGAIEQAPKGKIEDWLELKNVDIFAEAWVNGYTVEKEKRYLVKIKGLISNYSILKYQPLDNSWFMGSEQEYEFFEFKHTKEKLEEAGFGWVFDCPGIEVEEVEE
jgi:ORF19